MSAALVLVVGRPASGKTTLSRVLAERLALPLLAKDAFKERLFDALGSGDRAWSMRLGRAAFDLLDLAIEEAARTGRSAVVDAAFDAAFAGPRLQALQRDSGFVAVQVHCVCSDAELVRRFGVRAASGERHAGHGDAAEVEAFAASLREARQQTLPLEGPVLRVDTEDPAERDARRVLDRLRAARSR